MAYAEASDLDAVRRTGIGYDPVRKTTQIEWDAFQADPKVMSVSLPLDRRVEADACKGHSGGNESKITKRAEKHGGRAAVSFIMLNGIFREDKA